MDGGWSLHTDFDQHRSMITPPRLMLVVNNLNAYKSIHPVRGYKAEVDMPRQVSLTQAAWCWASCTSPRSGCILWART